MSKIIDIALIATQQQIDSLNILIKSICFHHTQVKFHIIHTDISQHWFDGLNAQLSFLDSQAISIPILNHIFKQYEPFNPHMNLYAYLKLSIPQFVHSDRVLFLNNECVVNSSLLDLWMLDLTNYALAAVPDLFLDHLSVIHNKFPDLKPYFNAGVLLFNNVLCNNSPFYSQVYKALQEQQQLSFAEQDILNLTCVGRWYPLTKLYNFQSGTKYLFTQYQVPHLADEAINLYGHTPKIIQYNLLQPLNDQGIEVPFEELYIFYADLDWKEIVKKWTFKV